MTLFFQIASINYQLSMNNQASIINKKLSDNWQMPTLKIENCGMKIGATERSDS